MLGGTLVLALLLQWPWCSPPPLSPPLADLPLPVLTLPWPRPVGENLVLHHTTCQTVRRMIPQYRDLCPSSLMTLPGRNQSRGFASFFASCSARAMSHFLGAARNEVFRHYPRWHYLAARILTQLSNDSSLRRYGIIGSNSDSLFAVTAATSITATCAIDCAGNLELLEHLLADPS